MKQKRTKAERALDIWVAYRGGTTVLPMVIAQAHDPNDEVLRAIAIATEQGDTVARYSVATGPAIKRHVSNTVVQTPPLFIAAVKERFGSISWDLAASTGLGVVGEHRRWGPEHDSLTLDWTSVVGNAWLNPPFDPISPWVEKAAKYQQAVTHLAGSGSAILMLLPYAPGTKWWRNHVAPFAKVYSIGRLKFVGQSWVLPKDLALCVYSADSAKSPMEYWDWKRA